MEERIYKQTDKDAYSIEWMKGLNQSGYVGCNPNGNIVDRREFPKAVPARRNSIFGIVDAKPLYECEFSDNEIKFLTQEEIDEVTESADEFDGFLGLNVKKVWK